MIYDQALTKKYLSWRVDHSSRGLIRGWVQLWGNKRKWPIDHTGNQAAEYKCVLNANVQDKSKKCFECEKQRLKNSLKKKKERKTQTNIKRFWCMFIFLPCRSKRNSKMWSASWRLWKWNTLSWTSPATSRTACGWGKMSQRRRSPPTASHSLHRFSMRRATVGWAKMHL